MLSDDFGRRILFDLLRCNVPAHDSACWSNMKIAWSRILNQNTIVSHFDVKAGCMFLCFAVMAQLSFARYLDLLQIELDENQTLI
jgi:hypothetical protein